jgi:hypothetical protein
MVAFHRNRSSSVAGDALTPGGASSRIRLRSDASRISATRRLDLAAPAPVPAAAAAAAVPAAVAAAAAVATVPPPALVVGAAARSPPDPSAMHQSVGF